MGITLRALRAPKIARVLIAVLLTLMIGADALAQPRRTPRPDFRLRVGRFHWDPLVETLPRAVRPNPAFAQSKYVIVQFHRPLNANQRSALRQHGLRLDQYLHYLGFIERRNLVEDIPNQLHPMVRKVVPYIAAFKSIGVPGAINRGAVPPGRRVRVLLQRDEDPGAFLATLPAPIGGRRLTIPPGQPDWTLPELHLVPADDKEIIALLERDEVLWIEWIRAPDPDSGSDDAAHLQSGHAALWPIWAHGLTGEDHYVGVIDVGVPRDDHCFLSNAIKHVRNISAEGNKNHATRASGIVAGDHAEEPGAHANRGHAWSAFITYGNVNDIGPDGPQTYAAYLEAAANDGASVHTNSWHFTAEEWMALPGDEAAYQYDYTAYQADEFTWNDETQVIVASASNYGEALGPPAVAFNTLAVGAADYATDSFEDGSGDLTDDGRVKPEICTPGCLVETSDSRDVCAIEHDFDCYASWATPAAAGAAVLVRQYFIDGHYPGDWTTGETQVPSSALVRAIMINATKKLFLYEGVYPCPLAGFGASVLDDALWFPGDSRLLLARDVLNEHGLEDGGSMTYAFSVEDSGEELRVTLAWTSPPGTPPWPAANDLDLIVRSPEGEPLDNLGFPTSTVDSSPNKAEIVRVVNPMVGVWTAEVRGGSVVHLPDDRQQGYALCVSGAIQFDP